VAQSHDGGTTWTQTKLVDGRRYFFAFDAEVTPDGTVLLSESSFAYTAPGGAAEGKVKHHVFISRDQGVTWQNIVLDTVKLGRPCETEGCSADFHSGHNAVSADGDGDLAYLYDGATVAGGAQRTWLRTSTNEGRMWSGRTRLSPAGVHTTGPTVEATGRRLSRLVRRPERIEALERPVSAIDGWRYDMDPTGQDLRCQFGR